MSYHSPLTSMKSSKYLQQKKPTFIYSIYFQDTLFICYFRGQLAILFLLETAGKF